ncbi:MAG: hypothetical protein H6Q41_2741 [Deltaproteobacteria bacterium]|nr:hypothetical protein [Deltaproteobacteria bacterium]
MGKKIRILVSELKVEAELNESKTAQLICRRIGILADRTCLLHLFRTHPGKPG